ncbi:hypothetical protein MPER_13768, partial [Moniliophthora perniciosa FA553]
MCPAERPMQGIVPIVSIQGGNAEQPSSDPRVSVPASLRAPPKDPSADLQNQKPRG